MQVMARTIADNEENIVVCSGSRVTRDSIDIYRERNVVVPLIAIIEGGCATGGVTLLLDDARLYPGLKTSCCCFPSVPMSANDFSLQKVIPYGSIRSCKKYTATCESRTSRVGRLIRFLRRRRASEESV